MTTQPMTLEVAREILSNLYRHVLADHAFGDAEVWWTTEQTGGSPVAGGYKGSRGTSVWIDAYSEHGAVSFDGAEARELILVGKYGSHTRNDETGDDYHCPLY